MRLPRARAPVAVASLLLACCCCLAPTRTRADVCGKPSKETWEGECSASAVSGRPLRARRAFTSAGAAPIGRRGRGGCCCVSADAGRVRAGRSAAGANRTARAFTCWRTGPGTRARCRALHTRACCRVCCGCVRVRCGARAPRTGEQERQQHSVPLTRACAAVQERAARRMGHLHVDQRPALRGRVEGRAASWPGPRPLLPRVLGQRRASTGQRLFAGSGRLSRSARARSFSVRATSFRCSMRNARGTAGRLHVAGWQKVRGRQCQWKAPGQGQILVAGERACCPRAL